MALLAVLALASSVAGAQHIPTAAERLNAEIPGMHQRGATIVAWKPTTRKIGYGFGALIDRTEDDGADPHSILTVGAQINATNGPGIHQVVFGIATEATALLGSRSFLTGSEATALNMEPSNNSRKVAYFATFKNRWDYQCDSPPASAMNVDSQALRIESFPGTGFERGIVFAPDSLHPSTIEPFPIVVDFKQVPMGKMTQWALVRYPDGWCEFYIGAGQKVTRPCN